MSRKAAAMFTVIAVLGISGCANSQEGAKVELQGTTSSSVGASEYTGVGTPNADAGNHSRQGRALVIAISTYAKNSDNSGAKGWRDINAMNDVPLITGSLRRHGFQDVKTLPEDQATKANIIAAWRELIRSSNKGDTLVFHFSGHGQQVRDRGVIDEADGYDEAMVPYDAPMTEDGGYEGEKHLTDDEFESLIEEAREKVGREGNIVAWVDACYSGSIGRGEASRRGADTPLGDPHSGRLGIRSEEGKSGFGDGFRSGLARGPSKTVGAELAPYVIFSASGYNSEARETYDKDRDYLPVGSLSFGLSKALQEANPQSTYRDVFEGVKRAMQAQGVPNEPEFEGDVDGLVFNGRAVAQEPFFSVEEVINEKTVRIGAGVLLGLRSKSVVELHPKGTRKPGPNSMIADGVIENADLMSANVILEKPVTMDQLAEARVFVREYNYGGTNLNIKFETSGAIQAKELAKLKDRIRSWLKQLKVRNIEVVSTEHADLTIRIVDNGSVQVERTDYGNIILGPLSGGRGDLLDVMGNRIQDFALNHYFQNLSVTSDELDVDFEIIPVKVTNCLNPERYNKKQCDVERVEDVPIGGDGSAAYPMGSFFTIDVHNRSPMDVNVAILDLRADGTIDSLWQVYKRTDKTKVPSLKTWQLPPLYRFETRAPLETLLLIATPKWINTDLVVTPPHERGLQPQQAFARGPVGPVAKGAIGPLETIFSKNARIETYYDPNFVTTKRIQVSVVPVQ